MTVLIQVIGAATATAQSAQRKDRSTMSDDRFSAEVDRLRDAEAKQDPNAKTFKNVDNPAAEVEFTEDWIASEQEPEGLSDLQADLLALEEGDVEVSRSDTKATIDDLLISQNRQVEPVFETSEAENNNQQQTLFTQVAADTRAGLVPTDEAVSLSNSVASASSATDTKISATQTPFLAHDVGASSKDSHAQVLSPVQGEIEAVSVQDLAQQRKGPGALGPAIFAQKQNPATEFSFVEQDITKAGPKSIDDEPTTMGAFSAARLVQTEAALAHGGGQAPEFEAPRDARAHLHLETTPHEKGAVENKTTQTPDLRLVVNEASGKPFANYASVALGDAGPLGIGASLDAQSSSPRPLDIPISQVGAKPTNLQLLSQSLTSQPVNQSVAIAIDAKLNGKGPDTVELMLEPQELGRLRITMVTRETGLFVMLSAERAETIDLMRRNSEELQANLDALDLGGAQLGFEHSPDQSDWFDDEAGTEPDLTISLAQPVERPNGPVIQADDRLDLRL